MASKAVLKEAKLALKDKNFDETIRLCEGLLASEPDNYHALVLQGVAYTKKGSFQEAEDKYTRATAVSPEQGLAWQGLADLYENENGTVLKDSHNKNAAALQQLIGACDPASDKLPGLLEKRAAALEKARQWSAAAAARHQLVQHQAPEDQAATLQQVVNDVQAEFAAVVETYMTSTTKRYNRAASNRLAVQDRPEESALLATSFKALFDLLPVTDENAPALFEQYTAHLQRQRECSGNDDALLVKACRAVATRFGAAMPQPHAHLCRLLEQDNSNVSAEEHAEALQALKTNFPESCFGLLAQALDAGDADTKVELLTRANDLDKDCLTICLQLAQLLQKRDAGRAVEICRSSLDQIQQLQADAGRTWWSSIKASFLVCASTAYISCGSSSYSDAGMALQQLLAMNENDTRALAGLAELALLQHQFTEARSRAEQTLAVDSDNVGGLCALAWVEYHNKATDKAVDLLHQAITKSGESAVALYRLAMALWAQGTDSKTVASKLLQAAKLDPLNSDVFGGLGLYYLKVAGNVDRATKCFQKALSLNQVNEVAGEALCTLHLQAKDTASAYDLCKRVTEASNAGRSKWAWYRLGMLQLDKQDHVSAVTSFQNAVRADASDASCWEFLGEAYAGRGSYLAALKALKRATELNPSATVCHCRIAKIQQILGLDVEAEQQYRNVVQLAPTFLPALVGLAEVLYSKAHAQASDGRYGSAADSISDAIATLGTSLQVSSAFHSVWKLMGDACAFTACLPVADVQRVVRVPDVLRGGAEGGEPSVLAAATLAYRNCLQLATQAEGGSDDPAQARNDIAVSLYHRSVHAADPAQKQQFLTEAHQQLLVALKQSPKDASFWSNLGVVAGARQDWALAQHSFIRALQLEPQRAEVWVNLGAVYLVHSSGEHANLAFAKAQSLLPSLARGWVGQALLAESMAHHDALDLFRHSVELHPHPEGCAGFASRTIAASTAATEEEVEEKFPRQGEPRRCETGDIPKGFAAQYLNQAAVVLTRYTAASGRNDACAWNMLGLLNERLKLFIPAAEAFQESFLLLQQQAGQPGVAEQVEIVRLNHARVLGAAGSLQPALQEFGESHISSLTQHCAHAMVLFKTGQYAEALQAYQAAFGLAPPKSARAAEILVSMAICAYAAQNAEHARQYLIQATSEPGLCPRALFVMCALGLVTGDGDLAQAALAEFPKLQAVSVGHAQAQHVADQHLLTAKLKVLQGDPVGARNQLSKAVMAFPEDAENRASLASLLIGQADSLFHINPQASQADRMSSRLAPFETASSASILCGESLEGQPESSYCLGASSLLLGGRTPAGNALVEAQKATRASPTSPHAWATLGAACYSEAARCGSDQRAKELFHLAARHCQLSAVLAEQQRTQLQTTAGQHSAALLDELRHWCEVTVCHSFVACARLEQQPEQRTQFLQDALKVCTHASSLYQQQPQRVAPFEIVASQCHALHGTPAEQVLPAAVAAAEKDPSQVFLWQSAAAVALQCGQSAVAENCLRQALSTLAPTATRRLSVLMRLALIAVQTNNSALANEATVLCLEMDPTQGSVRFLLGLSKLIANDTKGALKEFARAGETVPEAHCFAFSLHCEKKNADQAATALESAVRGGVAEALLAAMHQRFVPLLPPAKQNEAKQRLAAGANYAEAQLWTLV